MTLARALVLLASILTLTGCPTTGGTIGGLIPVPKFLKGKIKNNIYTARDKSFSVMVPHKGGTTDYSHMQVKEQYSESEIYVSFGPALYDQAIYRVDVVKRTPGSGPSMRIDDIAAKALHGYKQELQRAYSVPPKETEVRSDVINGRKALFWKLTQLVPPGKFLDSQETTLTHEVYLVEFDTTIVLVAVQIPADLMSKEPVDSRQFTESVIVY